jgi:hypothetical protein
MIESAGALMLTIPMSQGSVLMKETKKGDNR